MIVKYNLGDSVLSVCLLSELSLLFSMLSQLTLFMFNYVFRLMLLI